MGSVIVGAVPGFEDTLDAVRHHHERWDGGGYPFGLAGEETPLIARLMAVADAYSAMTTGPALPQRLRHRNKALDDFEKMVLEPSGTPPASSLSSMPAAPPSATAPAWNRVFPPLPLPGTTRSYD